MKKTLKRLHLLPALVGLGLSCASVSVFAQDNASAAKAPAPTGPIICADYKKGKTNLVGQRTGKKVQAAFEAYNEERIQDAITILEEIDTDDEFDTAYVGRFLGQVLAPMEGQGNRALGYLTDAVNPKVLNDNEHASLLKLIGDLSMQEKKYLQAVDYYERWMDFTCKQDPMVYTRMANAYYESKMYPEMIAPADKAIGLFEEPNKNPFVLKLSSYYERKMYKEATGVAEQLVMNFPDDANWWSQLGYFYLSLEDYDRALSTFEIAYNNGFLTKKTQIETLAQVYGALGIPHKSAEITKKYIESGLIDKTGDTLARLANSYHQARDYKTAAKYYGEAAELSSDPDHYQKQGSLLLVAEDYKGAIKALQNALDRGTEEVAQVHYALMEANFYSGDFKQAFVHVNEAKKDRKVRRNANAWVPYIETKAKNRGIKL